MSNYPNQLDNDLTLPSALDGAAENTAEAINNMKDAILAIQKALGVDPQGSVADLVNRLSASLNDNGTLKASALIAAGMVALPITNTQIGAAAGIAESKLDLDFATQSLKNSITSAEIDIDNLQNAVLVLLGNFAQHVNGTGFNHDGYQIKLDLNSPNTAPGWLVGINAVDVSTAIGLLALDAFNHKSASAIGAHTAANISTETFGSIPATNVQEALELLSEQRAIELEYHQDAMHANGISRWENDTIGWNRNLQLFPSSGTYAATATSSNILRFTGANLPAAFIKRGDVVVIGNEGYQILDIGPRAGIGSKPTLTIEQVELVESVQNGSTYDASIFAKASIDNIKVPMAIGILPGNNTVDTVVLAKPNAARFVSLGFKPQFIADTDTLEIEAGVVGGVRTITVTNLNKDRTGISSVNVTAQTVAERINYVLSCSVVGNNFPVSAYVIGSELALAHNLDTIDSTLKVLDSTGASAAGAASLGFGFRGANIVNQTAKAGFGGNYFVDGQQLSGFFTQYSGVATVSGSTFTVVGVDLIVAGIKPGQLIHLIDGPVLSELGSYQITAVSSTSISVAETLTSSIGVEILVDSASVAFADLDGSAQSTLFEIFVQRNGITGKSLRARYTDTISGIKITNIFDSMQAGNYTLSSTASGSNLILKFSTDPAQVGTIVAANFIGIVKVYGPTNVDFIEVSLNGTAGIGSTAVTIYDHIDEEDLLEIGQIRLAGRTIEKVSDKRLFGTLGIDELREDVVQAYIETPIAELRSSGIVRGFGILNDNVDVSALGYPAGTKAVYIDGGIGYIEGVRVVQVAQNVAIPNTDGSYVVYINNDSSIQVVNQNVWSLTDIIAGAHGAVLPICTTIRAGSTIASTSVVYNVSNIDERIDAVLDLTNNYIGNFNNVNAAIAYLNAFPQKERARLRLISKDASSVSFAGLNVPLELVIDGYVETLEINSDMKISSTGPKNTLIPHVRNLNILTTNVEVSGLVLSNVTMDATLLTDGYYTYDDCKFVNAASIIALDSAFAIKKIHFNNIESDTTSLFFSINSKNASFELKNSILKSNGDASAISSYYCEVHNTIFDNMRVRLTAASGLPVVIDNCEFRNLTNLASGQYGLRVSTNKAYISNTDFSYISVLAGARVVWVNSGSILNDITFDNCSVNYVSNVVPGVSVLSSGVDSFAKNITFTNFTSSLTTDPTVSIDIIDGLRNYSLDTNIVKLAALNARNLYRVNVVESKGAELNVSDSFLLASGMNQIAEITSNISFKNVKFDVGAAVGLNSSVIGGTTSNVWIEGCTFITSLSGFALNFNSLTSIDGVFKDCLFSTNISSNSAPLANLKFLNCEFSQPVAFELGSNVTFDNCEFSTLSITGTYTGTRFTGNKFTTAEFLGFGLRSVMMNNTGNLIISGYQEELAISHLYGELTTNSSAEVTKGLISESILGSLSGLAGFTFSASKVFDNFFKATSVQFNSISNVFIEQNRFEQDIVISSSFNNSGFRLNSSLNGTLTITANINNTYITDNTNINYLVSGQATAITFTDNVGSDSALFSGRLINSQINDNRITTLSFPSLDVESLMLKGNITNNLLFNGGKSTYTKIFVSDCITDLISFAPAAANTILDRVVLSGISANNLLVFDALTFTSFPELYNFRLDSSAIGNISFFNSASQTPNVIADGLSVNRTTVDNFIIGGSTYDIPFTISNVSLDGNTIDSLCVGTTGIGLAGRKVKLENSRIVNNKIRGSFFYLTNTDGFTLDKNQFSGDIDIRVVAAAGKASMNNLKFINNSAIGYNLNIIPTELDGSTFYVSEFYGFNFDGNSINKMNFPAGVVEQPRLFAGFSFNNNLFGPNFFGTGAPTSGYGIFIEGSNATDEVTYLLNMSFDNNRTFLFNGVNSNYPFEIEFTVGNGDMEISNISITNNIALDFEIVRAAESVLINGLTVLNNSILKSTMDLNGSTANIKYLSNFILTGAGLVFGNIINCNNLLASNNTGSGALSVSATNLNSANIANNVLSNISIACTSISRMIMDSNNVSSTIALGGFSNYASGNNESKITNNFANVWSASSGDPIITAAQPRIYVWGNTGNTATNVTFSGTTASTTATANAITAGGIVP